MFCAVVIFFLLLQSSYQRPTQDVNDKLHLYGFLNSTTPDLLSLENAIKQFQKVNNLTSTGVLNKDLMERINARRCGMPAKLESFKEKDKWLKPEITYKIYNWSEPFTKQQIKNVIEDSINMWTNKVNLKITETTSNNADIVIYFTPQDGLYNVLGYAYYPENGDIYFDADENWTLNENESDQKTYLGWVAAHELGHALGLPHNKESIVSIMYPYYSSVYTKVDKIDIKRLRRKYGDAVLDNTNLCDGTPIDAILKADETMFIKGREYWTLSNGVIRGGPFALDGLYPGLPAKIDAAFKIGKSNYFLSDNVFFKVKDKSKSFTRKLISVGFDNIPSNIDATFFNSASGVIYFFKNSKYYALDIKKPVGRRLIVDGRNMSSDWEGIPKNLEAATLLEGSKVLFVKSGKCHIFSLDTKSILRTEDCSSTIYKC